MSQTPMGNKNNGSTPIYEQLMEEFKSRGQHVNELMNCRPLDWEAPYFRLMKSRRTETAVAVRKGSPKALEAAVKAWPDYQSDSVRTTSERAAEEAAQLEEKTFTVHDRRAISLPEFEHQLWTEAEKMQGIIDTKNARQTAGMVLSQIGLAVSDESRIEIEGRIEPIQRMVQSAEKFHTGVMNLAEAYADKPIVEQVDIQQLSADQIARALE